MTIIDSINRFVTLLLDTFRQVGRWRIWALLLAYFALLWVILYAHYDFLSPVFYGAMSLWTSLFSDDKAAGFGHYPGHFLLLAYFFQWAKLLVGLLFEGAVLGAVALLFFDSQVGAPKEERHSMKLVLGSYFHLVLGWAVLNGLMLLCYLFLPELFREWLSGSPRRSALFQYAILPGVSVGLLSLLFMTIPYVAVYGDNVLTAIGRSLRTFVRNPITCIFLSLIVLAGPIIMSILVDQAPTLVRKFNPDMVYWLLLGSLAVEVLANFVWMGTAVRLLIELEEE